MAKDTTGRLHVTVSSHETSGDVSRTVKVRLQPGEHVRRQVLNQQADKQLE